MLLVLCSFFAVWNLQAQQKCATNVLLEQRLNAHPDYAAAREQQRQQLAQQSATPPQQKTTGKVKIPVVFHVILSQLQISQLGGTNMILQRAMDQVAVLNEDFNAQNADRFKIPSAFASSLGSLDVEFGLAKRQPNGSSTNGVEILTTTLTGFSYAASNGSLPKSSSTNGLDAWDPMRYLNIWVVNISESGLLGYCIPPSFLSFGFNLGDLGVVVDYGAFGKRSSSINFFSPGTNDRGRTLTHEVGHFFELEHTFGNGSGCPGSNDVDDLIADTPPQDGPTYNATYPSRIIPYPLLDACSPNNPGVMWMNFMDYPDDSSLYMFTQGQAARVQNVLTSGVLKSLTEHPEILEWPTSVADVVAEYNLDIYPNPSSGKFTITFNPEQRLEAVTITDAVGKTHFRVVPSNLAISSYDINLTGLSHGVYMVHCTFANGTVTKKIVVQ